MRFVCNLSWFTDTATLIEGTEYELGPVTGRSLIFLAKDKLSCWELEPWMRKGRFAFKPGERPFFRSGSHGNQHILMPFYTPNNT